MADESLPNEIVQEDRLIRPRSYTDTRIAVLGNVDSGKSTFIGVIISGELDDGRGSARSRVFRFRHELETGRTSYVGHHVMGFTSDGQPVFMRAAASEKPMVRNKACREIMEHSDHTLSFIDLAGHEKYLRTTIAGLTGSYPDYAAIIIGANMGLSKMTKEHLGICLALEIPVLIFITKVDMCPEKVLKDTVKDLFRILKSPSANKLPIIIRHQKDLDLCLQSLNRTCPIFLVSAVSGLNIDLTRAFLSQLHPRSTHLEESKESEFSIDETFYVPGVGVVISGVVCQGPFRVGEMCYLGPFSNGSFRDVVIRSIHLKRTPVDHVESGEMTTFAIRATKRKDLFTKNEIRKGMVLVDSLERKITRSFDADVVILTHATTISEGYQSVVHTGNIRQSCSVVQIPTSVLRSGDRARLRFRFNLRPEYLHVGATFLFREGTTRGVGKVIAIIGDS